MDSTYRKKPLVLPKLKANAELLKALPELRKYLPDASSSSSHEHTSTASVTPASHHHHATLQNDSDNEELELPRMQEHLKRVKKERSDLIKALATVRSKQQYNNLSLQASDIKALRESLAEKQDVLNQLREKNALLEERIECLTLESQDCALSMPEPGGGVAGEKGDRLAVVLAEHEAATKEIETRIVQYQLLCNRNIRDRDVAERKMKDARELKSLVDDDVHTVSQNFYELYAAKEASERELGASMALYDDSKNEWKRRLRLRRLELKAMEKRLEGEAREAAQQAQLQAEKEAREELDKEEVEEAKRVIALEVNNPVTLAKLDAAEALWAELQAVAGANTPTAIIQAWEDLKDRAEALQSLLNTTYRQEERFRSSVLTPAHGGSTPAQEEGHHHRGSHAAHHDALAASDHGSLTLQESADFERIKRVCAAVELNLLGMMERIHIAKEYYSSVDGKKGDAEKNTSANSLLPSLATTTTTPTTANNNNNNGPAPDSINNKRTSIVTPRRASVILPRRVSALELSKARGGHGNRRGSVEILPAPNAVSPSSDDHARNSVFPQIPELLSQLSGAVLDLIRLQGKNHNEQSEKAKQRKGADVVVGYKRCTMAGPAWIETGESNTGTDSIIINNSKCMNDCDANQQQDNSKGEGVTVQDLEAVQRYLSKLVDSPMDPALELNTDPFKIETSDDEGDQRPIMDRSALKYRSQKIITRIKNKQKLNK